MSEPMRKQGRSSESYTPKKPEIASLIAQAGHLYDRHYCRPLCGWGTATHV